MSIGLAVALVGMTSLAVAMLLVPLLLRGRGAASREAYNLAVYRDQLSELDRDIGRGVLTPDQAEAARAEIGRRILALAPDAAAQKPASAVPFAVAVIAIIALPFASWSLYAALGSPAVPDQPFASRGDAPAATTAAEQNADGQPPHDMAEAMTKLAEHLKQQPDDLTGWILLARSEMSLGRFKEASDAYSHAATLSNNRLDVVGDWGEAQVLAAGGKVTQAARDAFEKTLHDPDNAPRSRYYLALATEQHGNTKGALQQWVDLEADSPADADWLPMLRQRITETAGKLGVDPAALKTSSGAARPTPAPTAPQMAAAPQPQPAATPSSTPDPEKVRQAQQALANAPAEDRQAMINSMVERLAARLEQQPEDVDGWARLGRSYMVLNQPAKARDAYARAVKLRPEDSSLKAAYAEAIAAAK